MIFLSIKGLRDASCLERVCLIGAEIWGDWRIRLFNAVNLEQGYGLIEIRSPKEVLPNEENF
jgi:hypothetical protein